MFLQKDIVEFINKIINVDTVKDQDVEKNIKEFYNYLRLTKMANEKTLKQVEKIVSCLPEIFALKQKIGYFDISIILNKENSIEQEKPKPKTKKKEPQKVYEEKHYHHYHETTSSSCGGGGGSRSGC